MRVLNEDSSDEEITTANNTRRESRSVTPRRRKIGQICYISASSCQVLWFPTRTYGEFPRPEVGSLDEWSLSPGEMIMPLRSLTFRDNLEGTQQ